jgi:hypothetical protein
MIQSHHKPQEAIIRKPIYKMSSRLQRMLLKLQNYQIKIMYTLGKEMHITDTLSRAFLKDAQSNIALEEQIKLTIHEHTSKLSVSPERLQIKKTATKEDRGHRNAGINGSYFHRRKQIYLRAFVRTGKYDIIYEVNGLNFKDQGSSYKRT